MRSAFVILCTVFIFVGCGVDNGSDISAEPNSSDRADVASSTYLTPGVPAEGVVPRFAKDVVQQFVVAVPEGTSMDYRATLTIGFLDQQIPEYMCKGDIHMASTFVANSDSELDQQAAMANLENNFEAGDMVGLLDRKLLEGGKEAGSLIIWVGAEGNLNKIEFTLLVEALPQLETIKQGEILLGSDNDNDRIIDGTNRPFPGVNDHFTVEEYNVLYEDFVSFSLKDLRWQETSLATIPLGSTAVVLDGGCKTGRDEQGPCSDFRAYNPVICKVAVEPVNSEM